MEKDRRGIFQRMPFHQLDINEGKGSAPVIETFAFNKVIADVTYAGDNTTWTDETKLNYGGTLSWSEEK